MAVRPYIDETKVMASPWRKRRLCMLHADQPMPAALRHLSGSGVFLETEARPRLGASVQLCHPEAGTIDGVIVAIARDGVSVSFDCGEKSVAFALAAITADMSGPAA